MMRFFQIYQFVVPLVLLPLAYWLWLARYGGDHRLAALAISLPVVFAYVIPGIGTNWLRLWEFNTRWRLGRFRPQHGFLFGTATSLFALAALDYPPRSFGVGEMVRAGFVLGSVLALWNWLYDAHAIRVGFIRIYTRKQFEGAEPATVVAEYALSLFGVFGLCYGAAIRAVEWQLASLQRWDRAWLVALAAHGVCLAAPVLAYIAVSWVRTGEAGLRAYERVSDEP
jgi:hypothetical protein